MLHQHKCGTFQKQERQEHQERSCCVCRQSPCGTKMNVQFTSVVAGTILCISERLKETYQNTSPRLSNNPSDLYVKLADSTDSTSGRAICYLVECWFLGEYEP